VATAQRERLLDDDLQEGASVAGLDERLRLAQPHRRGQPAVQLDHHDVAQGLAGIGVRQLVERRHLAGGLELAGREHR
jgi:hypothetical protein